jgi:hypothetical protein
MNEPGEDENILRAKVSALEDRIFLLLERATEDPTKMVLPHDALTLLRDAVVLRRKVLAEVSRLSGIRHREVKRWIEARYGDKPYH